MPRSISLLLLSLVLGACAPNPVWKERDAPFIDRAGQKTPQTQKVPTCPDCGQVLNWNADRCSNPDKPIRISWSEPESVD